MQETYENQLIQRSNEMVLTGIKDEQSVRTKGMLYAIFPGKDALALQNYHEEW